MIAPPLQITHSKALRKPEKLPDNAENVHLHDDTIAFLDKLRVFEIDGEYLYQEEFPTKDRYYVLWDYTTNLAWLADSSGFNYPRYVININPYKPKILDNPENIPESKITAKGLLEAEDDEFDFHHSPRAPRPEEEEEKEPEQEINEMTSSMALGSAPIAPKKKKQKVDTPYKGSWADTVNKTPIPKDRKWPSLAFPDKVNPNNWTKLNQSAEIIGNLLAEAEEQLADLSKIPTDKLRELVSVHRHAAQRNLRAFDSAKRGAEELYHRSGQVIPIYGPDGSGVVFDGSEWISESENLEKHKFEVVCLNASGEEISTKSFSSEEDAQSHIDKKNEKREEDEVGCSYKIRVVAKEHKDQFATESLGEMGYRGTGKDNFEAPDRPRRRTLKVGSKVRGIMGVHGGSSGTVTKVGSPYSSSGSPTVWVKSDDGKEWDTYAFNLSITESLPD